MEGLRERESVLLSYSLHQRPLIDINSPGSSKPFRNSGVDFHDVFGGPPRRFSMQEQARPGLGAGFDEDDDDKPVFGDDVASRMRLPSADFFADIFGGGSSVHSTPTRHGRDYAFPTSPGSRGLSPLPPRSDETVGTFNFPSQFSLPGKENKSSEVPKFRSSSSSNAAILHSLSSTSLSRFSSESIQPNYLFTGDEESPKSDKSEGDLKKESSKNSATSNNNNGHFHFSIYKWRSKGVPLDIPLRGKAFRSKDVAQSQPSNKTTPIDEADEFFPEKQASDVIKDEQEFVPSKDETQKPELVKSVPSLFYDDMEKAMDGIANASPSPALGYTKTTKKQDRKNSFSKSSEANSNTGKGVQFSETNNTNNGRSKVKDFVKIFNHERSPKAQDGPYMFFRSKSCKWSEKHAFEEEEEEEEENEEKSNNTPEKLEKQKSQININPKASNNEDLKQSVKVHATVQDRPTPGSDNSASDGSNKVTAEETDDSFHDNFQVKDITRDENNVQLLESTNNQEFTDIDAKIRKWTRGKEGNIRSLLSTLQYVLWAESGWRTVPLVDIIEGSAVKRAYQRAMLCLHPDKLQQKNASSQQKYMAEKVFDILQEAWNYFNTLGAI